MWIGGFFFVADCYDVGVRAWGFVTTLFMRAVAEVRVRVGNFSDP